MGFIKNVVKAVILIFAVIGFMSVGGKDFLMEKWSDFTDSNENSMAKTAQQIGDFTNISDEYEIDKAASALGYKGVLAEHRASGQKMIVVDSGKKPPITSKDFKDGSVNQKMKDMTKKLKLSFIDVKELNFSSKGKIKAYGKENQYVKFTAKVNKLPVGEIEGIISATNTEDGEDRILLSLNEKGKYSQIIAKNFFKDVK